MSILNQDGDYAWKTICPKCETKYVYEWDGNPKKWVCERYTCRSSGPWIHLVEYNATIDAKKPIKFISFSYKFNPPEDVPKTRIYDVRHTVRNPWRDPVLRKLDGRHPAVQEYVKRCEGASSIIKRTFDGGVVAVGCMGGKHRSVAIVEMLAARYREAGAEVEVVHRDLKKG